MRQVAHLMVLVLVVALTSACGGDGAKKRQSCGTSDECADGLCFESECYQACTAQEQGGTDEICVHRQSAADEADVCVVASEFGGCASPADCESVVHTGCQQVLCSADQTCEVSDLPATGDRPCVACTGAGDCADVEVGSCQAASCDDATGTCAVGSLPDQTPCPEANVCVAGECVFVEIPDCEGKVCGPDGVAGTCGHCTDPCTGEVDDDLCAPDGRSCDVEGICCPSCDGKVCGDDGCGGTCGGCDDDVACTADSCVDGACLHEKPNVQGDACNGVDDDCDGETDEEGCMCEGEVDCDDQNPCTDDGCDPLVGCVHTNNDTGCDDGDACSTGDRCVEGACVPTGELNCDDQNVCTDDVCDPLSGCSWPMNYDACDDGNPCTTGDTCAAATCLGGTPLGCDDGNPCTDDTCDPATGCAHANNTSACDDGDGCTVADTCADGLCLPGVPRNCADGDVCTVDGCELGACTHVTTPLTGVYEFCNGVDDDCDGETDEGTIVPIYPDADGDGYGPDGQGVPGCPGQVGKTVLAGDCNDGDEDIHPNALETCADGVDSDCDGSHNDEDALSCQPFHVDADGDSFGVDATVCLCVADDPSLVTTAGDCNDADGDVHPGATEVCNGKDDDCDGESDPEGSVACTPYYQDLDADTYGVGTPRCLCAPTDAYVANITGDCNDEDTDVHPGAPEVCNGKDDDCNDQQDEEDAEGCEPYYPDVDRDSFGGDPARCLCGPSGIYLASVGGDCDDDAAAVRPGAVDLAPSACASESLDWPLDVVRNDAADWRVQADMVVDSTGTPHLVWDGLTHAYKDAALGWQIGPAGSLAGSGAALAIDRSDVLYVAYLSAAANDLMVARFDDGTWVDLGTVDAELYGSGTVQVRSASIAVDGDGFVHLGYASAASGDVRATYATNRSGAWVVTYVDPGVKTGTVTLALDAADFPHVVHHTVDGAVRVATNRSGAWAAREVLPSVGAYTGYVLAATIDRAGRTQFTYLGDGTESGFRLASETADGWTSTQIEPGGVSCYYVRLLADHAGWLHLAYERAAEATVVHATDRGGEWHQMTVGGSFDDSLALGFDPAGVPMIAWAKFDDAASDWGLRVATEARTCSVYGEEGDANCDGVDGTDGDRDGFASILTGGSDCDDANDQVYSGRDELCNGLDDNCDGGLDEACDADADGVYDNFDGKGIPGDDPCRGGFSPSSCDDNCPSLANPDQSDVDADAVGDVCDPDFGV